jgi:hypothetical protein
MDYKSKYIKYKTKYLNLFNKINQKGGQIGKCDIIAIINKYQKLFGIITDILFRKLKGHGLSSTYVDDYTTPENNPEIRCGLSANFIHNMLNMNINSVKLDFPLTREQIDEIFEYNNCENNSIIYNISMHNYDHVLIIELKSTGQKLLHNSWVGECGIITVKLTDDLISRLKNIIYDSMNINETNKKDFNRKIDSCFIDIFGRKICGTVYDRQGFIIKKCLNTTDFTLDCYKHIFDIFKLYMEYVLYYDVFLLNECSDGDIDPQNEKDVYNFKTYIERLYFEILLGKLKSDKISSIRKIITSEFDNLKKDIYEFLNEKQKTELNAIIEKIKYINTIYNTDESLVLHTKEVIFRQIEEKRIKYKIEKIEKRW